MEMFRYLLGKGAVLEEAGDSFIHAGAFAMNLARVFGLDSMAAELVKEGVPEDLRLHSVPGYDEWALHPVKQIEYDPYLKEARKSTMREAPSRNAKLGFDQAHCLPIGEVTRRGLAMGF
jgi:hypothetical protein